LNPYELGNSPAVEVVVRQHMASVASAVFAGIALCSCAVVFGYVIHTLDRLGDGFTPDPYVMDAGFGTWGICSLLGVTFGVTGLLRQRGRRVFPMMCLLFNVLLLLSLTGLFVLGRALGPT
jgi:hypothetical protein